MAAYTSQIVDSEAGGPGPCRPCLLVDDFRLLLQGIPVRGFWKTQQKGAPLFVAGFLAQQARTLPHCLARHFPGQDTIQQASSASGEAGRPPSRNQKALPFAQSKDPSNS